MANSPNSSSSSLLNRKTLCVITGASRGIGKEIAVRLSETLGENSSFLLVARNSENLHRVSSEIRARSTTSPHVEILTLDLSKFASHESAFDNSLDKILRRCDKFDLAMVVHNAGTLGDISKKANEFNVDEIRDYMELNFVSFVLLNNAFLKVITSDKADLRVIINITSLLAIKGMPGYGLYGAGKAAREGYLKSLSADEPSIRVLNYSPGPVATDMQNQIIAESWCESTKNWTKEAQKESTLVTCEQTVTKLLELLRENSFENGSHVDYYDI